MGTATYSIDSFEVGDYVVFERIFTPEDRDAFRAISGDASRLHNDAAYAAATPFGQIIVPLQLTLAPLSMIAGMIFPGEPALCLTLDVRAARPVNYGEELRYSARIEAINASHRVLTLRIIVLRGNEVMLDAVMRVQARLAEWSTPPSLPVRKSAWPATALVTGASGRVGGAISLALARQGWRLVLQYRGDDKRCQPLRDALGRIGAKTSFVAADLASSAGQAALAKAAGDVPELALIVHAASPQITAPLDQLMNVNYTALAKVIDAALPAFLARQNAAVVTVGPSDLECLPPEGDGYRAVIGMACTLVDRVERDYAVFGVRGLQLLAGPAATPFSAAFRGSEPALLPQEIAEALLQLIGDRQSPGNVMKVDLAGCTRGRFGFDTEPCRGAAQSRDSPTAAPEKALSAVTSADGHSPAAPLVRKLLRLADNTDLSAAALGITPGWDSLKQIEILVSLESALGIRFASGEMESLHRFSELDVLCRRKIAERSSRP